MGCGVKSRSSDPGSGDPAKDTGLPSAIALAAHLPLPARPGRLRVHAKGHLADPQRPAYLLPAVGICCWPWPWILPVSLPAFLHLLRLALKHHSLPLLAREDFPALLGKSAMCLQPRIQGRNQESKIALVSRASTGWAFRALSCFHPYFCKPRRQLSDGFRLAGEEKSQKGDVKSLSEVT